MYYERLLLASTMEKIAKKKKKNGKKKESDKKKVLDTGASLGSVLAGIAGGYTGHKSTLWAGQAALNSAKTPDGPSPLFLKLLRYMKDKGVDTYLTNEKLVEKIGPFYVPMNNNHPLAGKVVMHRDMLDPGIMAHEFGHSQVDRSKWRDLDNWAQDLGHGVGMTTSALGTIGNGFLAAGGNNYKLMGLIAGINAAANAPILASELAASWKGQNALGDLGGGFGDRLGAFKGIPSYAAAALAPAIPMLGRYLYDKFTEPKEEDEDEKE